VRSRTLFLAAFALGVAVALGLLLAGPVILGPAIVVWSSLLVRRPHAVGAAGGLVGFGAAWLLVVGQASYRCASDPTCAEPNAEPWLLVGGAILSSGLALALAAAWEERHR
jgi:hypothetical protein